MWPSLPNTCPHTQQPGICHELPPQTGACERAAAVTSTRARTRRGNEMEAAGVCKNAGSASTSDRVCVGFAGTKNSSTSKKPVLRVHTRTKTRKQGPHPSRARDCGWGWTAAALASLAPGHAPLRGAGAHDLLVHRVVRALLEPHVAAKVVVQGHQPRLHERLQDTHHALEHLRVGGHGGAIAAGCRLLAQALVPARTHCRV